MANRYIKRSSISVIIREMHIKTTRRCHLTPVRIPVVKRQEITKFSKDVNGNPCTLLVNISLVHSPWIMVCKFYKKLKMELPYHPASPLLNTHTKKMKSGSQRDICTLVFITTLIITVA